MNSTSVKISSFRMLPRGWHFNQGVPASTEAAILAEIFLEGYIALGFDDTDAFPGVDGEVMVTAYKADYVIEVLVETDLTVRLTFERGKEEIFYREGMSPYVAFLTLGSVAKGVKSGTWLTSESFTVNTSITREADLRTLLSGPIETNAMPSSSLALTRTVQPKEMEPSAPILRFSMPLLPQNQPYTGSLTSSNFLLEAA